MQQQQVYYMLIAQALRMLDGFFSRNYFLRAENGGHTECPLVTSHYCPKRQSSSECVGMSRVSYRKKHIVSIF